jgi:hypothetical protein
MQECFKILKAYVGWYQLIVRMATILYGPPAMTHLSAPEKSGECICLMWFLLAATGETEILVIANPHTQGVNVCWSICY